ncbi:regulatory protein TetR [Sphingobium chlorophenolicum L-1]|uniref:Regulatory protein TetR n=1 Tax=Sphingobium chlorophenolicum L-1 TaxID=690566 RepID=F6EZ85_SPHCR|nr:TetR/AcrR family transcriptional regulator [Sphingobium chlorophenolicum]AEG50178.1 regulatory protein TetR [Sphingobium chlorophenolicum L-1]
MTEILDVPAAGSEPAAPSQPGRRRKTNRREQQRGIETRRTILEAALVEFAERGFDGASTRRIGERAGLEHTLITYHYRNKEALWRAVAEYAFDQIMAAWDDAMPPLSKMTAAQRLRAEFRAFLQFTTNHSAFHHFMLRENQVNSPRLTWLIENVVSRTRDRVMPHIRAAQADGELIQADPDLIYYMLIGMTSAPSSLHGEMAATIGFSLEDANRIEEYWQLIERSIFK